MQGRRVLGALRHRNYRLYFTGQAIATIGTWMSSIAQSWLVLQMTDSGLWVGLVLATQFTPILVLGPVGGLVADRYPKRRVLQVTQSLFIIPALTLFLISTHLNQAHVWMVFCSALFFGCIQVFDVPARQSFVIEMVGREDLMQAIALNSTVWNTAAVIGPSIAGLLIAYIGLPFCFLTNSLTYFGSITALTLMTNLPAVVRGSEQGPVWKRLLEGANYARRDPVVGPMLLLTATFSLFAMNRLTLIPLFAKQVLHAGPAGYGFLMASIGFGSMTAAFSLAVFARRASGSMQFFVGLGWVLALAAFSFSRVFWLSAFLLWVSGFCQISFLATTNTRIQTLTPDNLRGRVMSLYAQSLMGTNPVGSSSAGALSAAFGAPVAMLIGTVVAVVVLVVVRVVRPGVFSTDSSPSAF
jgi:MFS family permease